MTRSGLSKGAGPQRAAGMLLPAYKTHTPLGQAAGWLADATVGSLLGIATVYTPVSYTHLDVYKRQSPQSPSSAFFSFFAAAFVVPADGEKHTSLDMLIPEVIL